MVEPEVLLRGIADRFLDGCKIPAGQASHIHFRVIAFHNFEGDERHSIACHFPWKGTDRSDDDRNPGSDGKDRRSSRRRSRDTKELDHDLAIDDALVGKEEDGPSLLEGAEYLPCPLRARDDLHPKPPSEFSNIAVEEGVRLRMCYRVEWELVSREC
jgi:hypothetical protein